MGRAQRPWRGYPPRTGDGALRRRTVSDRRQHRPMPCAPRPHRLTEYPRPVPGQFLGLRGAGWGEAVPASRVGTAEAPTPRARANAACRDGCAPPLLRTAWRPEGLRTMGCAISTGRRGAAADARFQIASTHRQMPRAPQPQELTGYAVFCRMLDKTLLNGAARMRTEPMGFEWHSVCFPSRHERHLSRLQRQGGA